MTESQLQSKICAYLQAKGYCFSRINNAPIYDPTRKIFRSLGKYVMRGFPDIIVCRGIDAHGKIRIPDTDMFIQSPTGGLFIGIEVKSKNGKLSDHQLLARKRILEARGFYYVVRSWEDFKKLLF